MPTTLEAFSVGYGLNMVGVYFESALMLARIGAGASADLKELCEQQMTALAQGAASTRWQIKVAGKALEAAGLTPPSAPTGVDDYSEWSEAVADVFYPKLEGNEQVAAYLFGWYLSSWIQYANMGVMGLFLKDAAPDNEAVVETMESIAADLTEARANVESVTPDIPLPEKAVAQVKRCLKQVQAAPPLDDSSQDILDVADDYQEALYELTEAVEALEKTLQ